MSPIRALTLLIGLSITIQSIEAINLNKLAIPVTEESEEAAVVKWKEMEKSMKEGVESIIKMILPSVLRTGSEVELSVECMSDMLRIVQDLRQLKTWTIHLLDAMGKPEGGNMMGTISMLGNYRECLDIKFPLREEETPEEGTVGQYCLVDFSLPLPPKPKVLRYRQDVFTNATFETEVVKELRKILFLMYLGGVRVGLCVPSSCSVQDMDNAIGAGVASLNMNSKVYSCEKEEEFSMDTVQIAIAGTILFILLLNVIATIIDVIWTSKDIPETDNRNQGIACKLVTSFSMIRNGSKTLSTKPFADTTLSCLNGIRVISMTWVIMGHSFSGVEPYLMRNVLQFESIVRGFAFQAVIHGIFSVETFYVVTALLMSYQVVNAVDSVGPRIFNVPLIIIRRIWRLLPVVVLVSGLIILLPLVGSGPLWKDTTNWFAESCRDNWWQTALFVQNYGNMKEMCLPHTWYLAVEFQCFLVGIIYLALYLKKPIFGKVFLFLLVVCSTIACGIVNYSHEFLPSITINIADFEAHFDYLQHYYAATYVHFGVFSVGLALGTFIARRGKFQLTNKAALLGWSIAFPVALCLVYISYPWNKGDLPSLFWGSVYAATCRTIWGGCVGWVVVACALGKGGPINTFLSHPIFSALTQITYATYVIHIVVVWGFSSALQGVSGATTAVFVWLYFGNLIVSAMAGFSIKMLLEAPLNNVFNIFIATIMGKPKRKSGTENGTEAVNGIAVVSEPVHVIPELSTPVTNGDWSSKL